jgi:hypothetical protein
MQDIVEYLGNPRIAIRSDGTTCSTDAFGGFAIFANDGTLSFEYFGESFASCEGLDNYGDAVGETHVDLTAHLGVLYDPLNGARDLNQLIPKATVKGHSVVIQNAVSISDGGYIAADCTFTFPKKAAESHACLLSPNLVLILKKNVFQLAKGEPGCIQCQAVLDPEARSLPNTLAKLTTAQKARVIATVQKMEQQIYGLGITGGIPAQNAILLFHQAQLVIGALRKG